MVEFALNCITQSCMQDLCEHDSIEVKCGLQQRMNHLVMVSAHDLECWYLSWFFENSLCESFYVKEQEHRLRQIIAWWWCTLQSIFEADTSCFWKRLWNVDCCANDPVVVNLVILSSVTLTMYQKSEWGANCSHCSVSLASSISVFAVHHDDCKWPLWSVSWLWLLVVFVQNACLLSTLSVCLIKTLVFSLAYSATNARMGFMKSLRDSAFTLLSFFKLSIVKIAKH